MNLTDTRYRLAVIQPDGDKVYVDEFVENLGWEDVEGQIATRLVANAVNDKATKKRIAQLMPNGAHVRAYAGERAREEVWRGQIFRNTTSWSGPDRRHDIIAYDNLYFLQQSEDDRYYPAGRTAKQIIKDVAGAWGIPAGTVNGPNVELAKQAFVGKKITEMCTSVLTQSRKKGAGRWFLRATEGKLETIKRGYGKRHALAFDGSNVGQLVVDRSIEELVTEVVIVGRTKDGSKVLATATSQFLEDYGRLRRIVNRSDYDTAAGAKKAAKALLEDEGSETRERSVIAVDVPSMRRGDVFHLKAGTINGFQIVDTIRHDAQAGLMEIAIRTSDPEVDIDFDIDGLFTWVPPEDRGGSSSGAGGDVDVGGSSAAGFAWPVRGTLTGFFGDPRSDHVHQGLDIAAPTGTPVGASKAGTVTFAGYASGYGNVVYISHGGYETRYAHLNSISARSGQQIGQGGSVGAVGSTGDSTGPHLHFEIRRGGVAVDPMAMLP